jgi:hypothetical protein
MSVLRPSLFGDGLKPLRNVHANGQERWTVGNFHAKYDQRSETFEKSR